MSSVEVERDNEWLPDPRLCPSWCGKQHAEALAEGNGWEASQVHRGSGLGECLSQLTYADRPVRAWGGAWDLNIEQIPLEDGGYVGPPLVHVTVSDADRRYVGLELTSGEARTLAAQLVAMADRLDL